MATEYTELAMMNQKYRGIIMETRNKYIKIFSFEKKSSGYE